MNVLESPQTHLLLTLALNALILFAARAVATRASVDFLTRLGDTLLLWFLGQYLCIGIPGVLGLLSLNSFPLMTVIVSAGFFALALRTSARLPAAPINRVQSIGRLAVLGFLIGYLGALLAIYLVSVPTGNDALTYHLPAAAQWLQEGRISLFQTWNFNPANTYSPLGGSVLIAWWMAPMQCDFFARFIAWFPLLLIGTGVARLATAAKLHLIPALLLGLAAILCWPILSQADKAKDDLYVVGFFLWGVVGLTSPGRFKSARIGVALGLMLAMKYTALLALPMLLPALSRRVPLKNAATILGLILLLAGPWYFRNLLLTGNPLFPSDFLWFHGLFSSSRAPEFRSFKGLWNVLAQRDYSFRPWIVWVLIFASAITIVMRFKVLRAERWARVVVLGPYIGIATVFLFSPFAEIRFILPPMVLMMASVALVPCAGATVLICVLALGVMFTTFSGNPELQRQFQIAGIGGAIVLGLTGAVFDLIPNAHRPGVRRATFIGLLALALFVGSLLGPSLLQTYLSNEANLQGWENAYGNATAQAWIETRSLPPDDAIAYAGTWYPYPLMGPAQHRPVVYVSPVESITSIATLPRLGEHLTGDPLIDAARRAVREQPDADIWWKRLKAIDVRYVFISKDHGPTPETTFVRDPQHFKVIFENTDAIIARVR